MLRTPVPLRHALLAALFVAAPALPLATASGQTVTLTFNSLTDLDGSGIRYVPNCYTEQGYVVTVVGVACGKKDALATGTSASPLMFTGSPALFLNDDKGKDIDFTKFGGGLFSFESIQLAPFIGATTTVNFTGFRFGAPSIFATAMVPGSLAGLLTFTPANFTGLTSLRLSATNEFGEPIVHFDNVRFTGQASAVPEPATLGLVFIGLVGMGAVTRRRRSM